MLWHGANLVSSQFLTSHSHYQVYRPRMKSRVKSGVTTVSIWHRIRFWYESQTLQQSWRSLGGLKSCHNQHDHISIHGGHIRSHQSISKHIRIQQNVVTNCVDQDHPSWVVCLHQEFLHGESLNEQQNVQISCAISVLYIPPIGNHNYIDR